MLQYSIGLSALQTAQQGLAIAGNNLTNASTPGYHRQVAAVTPLGSNQLGGISVGSGVTIDHINRAVSDQLDAALTQQTSQNAFVDQSLNTSTQIQQAISPNLTSPSTQLEAFLNSLQALSADPTSGAAQSTAINGAQSVAQSLNTAASDLTQIRQGLDQSINSLLSQVNPLTKQIANLNAQISSFPSSSPPNDLLDTRAQLVNNLAQLIGVQVQNANGNQVSLAVGGVPLVSGVQAQTLTATTNSSGTMQIMPLGGDTPLAVTSGQLGGLLSQRNETLPDYQQRLDTLAQQIAASFNAIQATGLGGTGGLQQLTSQNGAASTTAPLSIAGLNISPQAGSLYIGVTNAATGQRVLTEIPVDPSTQSLQDVANAIDSGVPNLQAFVSSQTGTITLAADSGYSFDFAGGYQAQPQTSFSGGSTTTATLGGTYTGPNNNYTVTFNADGTIGATAGLTADVTDSSGTVVTTLNIGQGYQAGQPITIANGLTVSFGAGNVITGDSISSPVVSNPDSANLLQSLGLNTLFTGHDAASLKVNANLVANPGQLAISRTGQAGDTSNLQRFVDLGAAKVLGQGTQSFSGYANQMVSDIGSSVQSLTQQQQTNTTLTANITAQQQSVSGVDTNEELANILQYQQMFALAGKYISAVNDTLQSLLQSM